MSDDFRERMAEAHALGHSQAAFDALQQLVQEADARKLDIWSLAVRKQLMLVCRMLLRSADLANAFAWTVAKYDESPEQFARFNPLYEYNWVIGLLANFPNIDLQQRDDLLADMKTRYERAGAGLNSVYEIQWSISIDYADEVLGNEARDRLLSLGNDWQGMFAYYDVHFALFLGDEARAIARGESFIEAMLAGKDESYDVCANLLLPLWRAGRQEEAQQLQAKMQRGIRRHEVYYWPNGEYLKFLAATQKVERAIKLFENFHSVVATHSDPLTRLYFYTDMIPVLNQLHQQTDLVALRLPESVTVTNQNDRYSVADLIAWHVASANELADQFDQRNGNPYFRNRIQQATETHYE